jgi:hypothetical protein
MKLNERRHEKVSDIKKESQAVLDSTKENDFQVLLKRGKNDWIAVYVPKENILKAMAAKIV